MRLLSLSFISVLLLSGCFGTSPLKPDGLKVTRAVLYQNGIGYFERRGKVEGQQITLRILPQLIADVLKSLTVVDLNDGRAINVALPVEKTRIRQLAALPEQVRQGGGLISIAQAFRGARAEVRASTGSAEGRLVGVEKTTEEGGWRLSILTEDGEIKSFEVDKVHSLQIQDRTLEVGLRKALDIALDEGSWKPVELSIHLAGKTPHDILVSYVVEMPTWKPAYRVVLSKGEAKGLLQGWAVVDNVSGEDWNKVSLSLTAGTPLTFTYDLYSPRFVRRPDLSPAQEAMAEAPPPPTDGAAPSMPAMEELAEAESDRDYDNKKYARAKKSKSMSRTRRRAKRPRPRASSPRGGLGVGTSTLSPAPPPKMTSKLLEKSFRALVAGSRVGSLFRYDIEEPVTIKDRQSALVSILNKKVPAEDVLLFRMDTSSTHPYRAVHLTNTTGYIIERGPVAIYQDGNFVGEAVGGQVEANTSTFIPYAKDGRYLISLEDRVADEGVRLLKIVNGEMQCESKRVSIFKYSVFNRSGEKATLYIQRKHRTGWKLIQPTKGVLIEKEHYFVPVPVAAKGKTSFEVREETPVKKWVSVYSYDGRKAIGLFLKNPNLDPKISASLREVLALQQQLDKLEREIRRVKRAKKTYSERQSQVRSNLKLLGRSVRNADLARKLTSTLLKLETKLNAVTRALVSKDMKRSELRDRLTVLMKSVTLEAK